MKLEQTFMHFILQHQIKNRRTLNFLILMESILTSAKVIQDNYTRGSLNDVLGETNNINVQGEKVMQLDEIAHKVVLHYLIESQQVISAISEESENIIDINPSGRYYIYFDPLDGSSNVQHSLPVGFMFGIAKKNLNGEEDHHLRSGDEFIAAGIFSIPTGNFTFALRDAGAWRFIVDNSGNYIRPTMLNINRDKKDWELSFNASNLDFYNKDVSTWLNENKSKYNFRYSGSLAIDFYRLLNNGGLFAYPAILNNPDKTRNKPDGKLRLMYESAVVAFIAKEAGGIAIDESGNDILSIKPEDPHQRSALYVGSKELIKELKEIL